MWGKLLTSFSVIFVFISGVLAVSVDETDTIIISRNKDGNFHSIGEAFNSIDCHSGKKIIFLLKPGIYNEKVVLFPTLSKVILIGENRDNTIVTFDDYSGKIVNNDTLTTHNSYTFRVLSDYFEARNITFQNTAGTIAQAVVIEIKSDCVVFNNCRFLGNQDTFYANSDGRIYVKNSYIEGTTDFIFGKSIVLFDSCTIYCKKNSFITAASTPENTKFGFVFRNCSIKADSSVTQVYLGRPWRSFAMVVFLNCYLGDFIIPEGWHNWSKPEREKTTYFAEYNSYGPGALAIMRRVSWSYQLSDKQAKEYSIENIFSKRASNINFSNNWIPKP